MIAFSEEALCSIAALIRGSTLLTQTEYPPCACSASTALRDSSDVVPEVSTVQFQFELVASRYYGFSFGQKYRLNINVVPTGISFRYALDRFLDKILDKF